MPRTVNVDINMLRKTIEDLENEQTFEGQKFLWEAVLNSPWGQAAGVSISYIINKVKENHIQIKTPSARGKSLALRANSSETQRHTDATRSVAVIDLSILKRAFGKYGIEVTGIESLLTSRYFTPEENQAVRNAWAEVRRIVKVPGPKLNANREYERSE